MKAVIIDRFQPLHKGHKKIIEQAMKENNELLILIGKSINDGNELRNPFTYDERERMIKESIKGNYEIKQLLDTNNDIEWTNQVKKLAGNEFTIYTGNTWVMNCLSDQQIKKLERINKISATRIRELIKEDNKEWTKLIPKKAIKILKEINGDNRIKNLIN